MATMLEVGKKFDEGKTRYDLIDNEAEEMLARVLTLGAKKYEAENWRKVDGWQRRYFAALRRHLKAWRRFLETGKEEDRIDSEWGLPHTAHAFTCMMFILAMDLSEADKRTLADVEALVGLPEMQRTGKAKSGHFGGKASAAARRARAKR